jgi:hypothetical protein
MKRIEPPRTLRARSLRGLCAFAVQKQFLSNAIPTLGWALDLLIVSAEQLSYSKKVLLCHA